MGKTAEDQRSKGNLYLPPTQPSSAQGNQSRHKGNKEPRYFTSAALTPSGLMIIPSRSAEGQYYQHNPTTSHQERECVSSQDYELQCTRSTLWYGSTYASHQPKPYRRANQPASQPIYRLDPETGRKNFTDRSTNRVCYSGLVCQNVLSFGTLHYISDLRG